MADQNNKLTPALEALKKRAETDPSMVFLELDVEETSPKLTHGFRDEQIREMDAEALSMQLQSLDREEKHLYDMLEDLRNRRQQTSDLIARKSEIT